MEYNLVYGNICSQKMKDALNYPAIDIHATGKRIGSLIEAKGYSLKDLQTYLGFSSPQAIYKWLWGKSLPSIDNLFALSVLLNTPIDDILIGKGMPCVTRPYSSAHPFKTPEASISYCGITLASA